MLTPAATRHLAPAIERVIAESKSAYRERLLEIERSFDPALSHGELSVGLGMRAPPLGQSGTSDIARFISTAPRNRRARPDTETRALIDEIHAGRLLIAARGPIGGREMIVCAAQDVRHLDASWDVRNVAGGPVPLRAAATDEDVDWDDPSLFEAVAEGRRPTFRPRVDARPSPARPRPVAGQSVHPVGLGCMRLSTAGRPARDVAIAVIHAALDAGVRLLDTADSYAIDDDDLHHDERLVREALGRWHGDAATVLVATKVGLGRPGGRWVPRGSPDHLREAAARSRDALGVDTLPLLQLHAPDPSVPFAAQVEALAKLREDGVAGAIGLCNVSPAQLREALTITPIVAVQHELSPFRGDAAGLLAPCLEAGIALLAYRPFGGWKRARGPGRTPAIRAVADRHGASPHAVALAWLLDLSPNVIPLPGTVDPIHARVAAEASAIALTDIDRAQLDASAPFAAEARLAVREALPPEVVLISGAPAAGKTTRTATYLARGYTRLNRDQRGGRLDDLLGPLHDALRDGARHVVMDNTYPTRKSRAGVVRVAREHGVPVRVEHLDIREADALVNAAGRLLDRAGALLGPDALAEAGKSDPNLLPPAAIRRFYETWEPPTAAEGFSDIHVVPFVRAGPAAGARAVFLDMDGTVRESTGGAPFPRKPDDVRLMPHRRDILGRYVEAGFLLVGVSNQAGVALGQVDEASVRACFEHTAALLGLPIDIRYCPHPAGVIRCFCRKPMPGMGVALARDHGIDLARSVMVGDRDSDERFARHLGLAYVDAAAFFDLGAERWGLG